jgi:CBS domain-containing protein
MKRYNISGLPVVEGQKLTGILTARDVRFARQDELVGNVMTKKVKTKTKIYVNLAHPDLADKVAAFTMPAARYDVYIIAKGKPGGCLDLEAYTYTTVEGVVTMIFIGSIDIEGWHDPVYRDELEMTGQVAGLNYLKRCRGGSRST